MIYRSLVSKINKLKFLQSPIKAHHLPPWWLYKHPVVWFARVPMISVSLTWEQVFFLPWCSPTLTVTAKESTLTFRERQQVDECHVTNGCEEKNQSNETTYRAWFFFHWLLNTCNWKTLCFRSCMVAIRLLLFHKMSSSQRLGYNFLIEIKPSGI